jgi:carboxyl-terminal processing protease
MRRSIEKVSVCIFIFSIIFFDKGYTQSFKENMNDAWVITRMADKFHVQPRPVDDDFSSKVFSALLMRLDNDKIFFTQQDIDALNPFKTQLDDEIKSHRETFLLKLSAICKKRLIITDSIINILEKKGVDFNLPGKITEEERINYPRDNALAAAKLSKYFKSSLLDLLMDDDDFIQRSPTSNNAYLDSILPHLKAIATFRNSLENVFENPQGINEALGIQFCQAIASCYDPHTEYFSLSEKENFESELGKQPMIFGFQFKEDNDGSVSVSKLLPGSPAFKSGQINKGDKIKSVQWESQSPIDLSNAGLKELYAAMDVSNHSKATFRIIKPDGSERYVVLYKAESEQEDDDNKVKSFILKGNKTIGFISLPSFYEDWENENSNVKGCANDVAKEIIKLKKENIQGLILDIRYNGGGSMREATELAGIFIDAGAVGLFKTRDDKVYALKDINRGSIWDGPLVLLVNGYSASASEMVAGTLQDYNRAIIIGSPTYGKATSQVILPLDTTVNMESDFSKSKANSYIKMTVSELYRVNGTTAQAKGVQPDIMLPDILDAFPQREADETNVLIAKDIEPYKYFKPYPPVDKTNLISVAKSVMLITPYFTQIKKYVELLSAQQNRKETDLNINEALKEKKIEQSSDSEILKGEKEKPPYEVQSNIYEKEQMLINHSLQQVNEQWSSFLSKDPYLHIAYEVIAAMK